MRNEYILFLIVIGICTFLAYVFNRYKDVRNKNKRAQEDLLKRYNFFKSLLPEIQKAKNDFIELLNLENGYCSNYKLKQWKDKHSKIIASRKGGKKYLDIQELNDSEKQDIQLFVRILNNPEKIVEQFNNEFVESEIKRTHDLLSNVDNGKSLDDIQRESIIRDEDNSLLIAGAGCGKTTTIMGKVIYLCDHLKIDPSEILLISYTNKSANDLISRVDRKNISASTFHKLGKDIISSIEGVPNLYEQSRSSFLKSEFERLISNKKYQALATKFITNYLKVEVDQVEFKSKKEQIQHLQGQNFRPFKKTEIVKNGLTTLKRERVKSQQECNIANFLFFNRIEYKYEAPYEHITRDEEYRQYCPDFSLYNDSNRIYLEHYGIDRKGNVPEFFANEKTTLEEAKIKYNDSIEWKREQHLSNETNCIESFSYEFTEEIIFQNLKASLEQNGFELNPMTESEKWDYLKENANEDIDSLIKLFDKFLVLFKSNNFSEEEFQSKIQEEKGIKNRRSKLFCQLFFPLFNAYQTMLQKEQRIDFSDMINRATKYIENGQYKAPFKYVLVDEYQDISVGRYKLLKALKTQNPAMKLVAVGDDWQSIFRFTGSDISLFSGFSKYFGYTNTSKIETTYRFGQPLIDISGNFIMKNESQIPKSLKSAFSLETNLEIFYSESKNPNDETDALLDAFEKIKQEIIAESDNDQSIFKQKIQKRKFLLLARNNKDFNKIKPKGDVIVRKNEQILFKVLDFYIEMNFLTVHRSKGLEADYVFVLNCNTGTLGFPSEKSDDPILNLLLGESERFPNSEERRLFYVAITRAKKKTSLLCKQQTPSKFIQELEQTDVKKSKKCPRCEIGNLVLKQGINNNKPWAFYGCSNFAIYDCNYKSKFLSQSEIEGLS